MKGKEEKERGKGRGKRKRKEERARSSCPESGRDYDEEVTAWNLVLLSRDSWTRKDVTVPTRRIMISCRKRTSQSQSSQAKKRIKAEVVRALDEEEDDDHSDHTPSSKKRSKKKRAAAVRVNYRDEDQGPMPPPAMPEAVKAIIEAMGGMDIFLVIQKRLSETDIGEQQNSLSIPFGKLFNKSQEFLTEGEKALLSRKDEKGKWNCIKTQLLDTKMEIWKKEVPLRKWEMNKSKKYVLTKQWKAIVKNNGLDASDVIQVWAFRVDGRLNLALVKIAA